MNGANGVSFGCVNTAAPVDPKEEPKKEEAGKEGEVRSGWERRVGGYDVNNNIRERCGMGWRSGFVSPT